MGLLDRIFGRWSNQHYQDGMRHFNRRDYAAAVDAFDRLLNDVKHGDNPEVELARFYAAEAHAKLGLACFHSQDLARARKEFESAVQVEEEYPDLHFHLGVIAEREGRLDDALGHLNRAVALHPDYSEAIGYRVLVLFQQEKVEGIKSDLQKLSTLKFELPQHLLGRESYSPEAISQLRDALEHHLEGKRHFKEAVAHAGRGDLEGAANELEQAIQENPTYPDLRHRYALVLADLGRHEQALQSYDKALELHPNYLDAFVGRGATLLALDRSQEALISLRKASDLNQGYADVQFLRGSAALKTGEITEARQCLEKALELNPSYVDAWLELGLLLEGQNQSDQARSAFRKVLDLQPDHPIAASHLVAK